MVIIFPAKKPKLEICEYKYCDGNHKISKCDETKCDGTHTKLRKVKNGKHGPNPYLKYALSNSMGRRFAQEKVQNQLIQNEQKLKNTNFYNSVSNLAEFEMEQENKEDELMEEEQSDPIRDTQFPSKEGVHKNKQTMEEEKSDQYYDCSTEVRQMKQYNPIKSLPLIRMLLIICSMTLLNVMA